MHRPPRPFLIAAALIAIGGFATAVDGCASKPPQPEPPTDAATRAPKPPPTPAATGTSPVAPTSASTGISPGIEASPGAGPSATASASTGGGNPPARASAGCGPSTGTRGGAETSASSGTSASPRTSTGGASADSAGGSAVPVDRAQTADERRAALDKRLNDSLGSFDAQLRKEQERIARERDARQTTVTTVAAVDSGAKPSADQNGEAAENPATEPSHKPSVSHRGAAGSPSPRAGDLKSDKSASGANGNASGNGAVAEEMPDGNDDDVVARRLRKAAEQETDPELKDKLWKEYVEYKKNTEGK
jgi:hypothetical protein